MAVEVEASMTRCAVIMAGGKGERFWPWSRSSVPKQFLSLVGDSSLLQRTIGRVSRLIPMERIYVVTGLEYVGLIRSQLPSLPSGNIIIEPVGRDTAPCAGLAALYLERNGHDSVMAVLPADHVIRDEEEFLGVFRAALEAAERFGGLVTIGIRPTRPETGYGYIKMGSPLEAVEGRQVYRVERFTEKPDLKTAREFVEEGSYLWNSGMFFWRTSVLRREISLHLPDIHNRLERIEADLGTPSEWETLEQEFPKMQKISIDYGIMEKAANAHVIPGEFGWDDAGSWSALERVMGVDRDGNVVAGKVIAVDTSRSIIQGRHRLIATVGIADLIVVETDDAVLVCKKGREQDVKALLARLKKEMPEYL